MLNLQMWWQGADRPFHCRPEDCFFSAEQPAEGAPEFVLRARPGQTAAVQLMLLSDADAAVTALATDVAWPVHVPALCGVNRRGRPMRQVVTLEAGKPWPIWVLVEVPMLAQGEHRFDFTVLMDGGESAEIELAMEVSGEILHHGGEDDGDTLARLAWLDSALGCEDTVTAPFLPIAADGKRFTILGREIALGENGLPERMLTHFTGINDALLAEGREIFAVPPRLEAVREGQPVAMTGECRVLSVAHTRVTWEAALAGGGLSCVVAGWLEFDGWMHFDVQWTAEADTALDDIRLVFAPKAEFARWFTGVGTMAVERPAYHRWQWDRQKQQDGFYCGGMNGGIVCRPVTDSYVRPYCNIYYKFGPRNQPETWVNGGEGYFELHSGEASTELGYHTGALTLAKGQTVTTHFELGFTPFKLVNQAAHYAVRYYQAPGESDPQGWIDKALRIGASHVVVHHAKEIYPFINYPMYDGPAMHDFTQAVHEAGLKMKPYYTVRELTSKLPEFFPLRSLRGEIFAQPNFHFDGVPGQGEKDAWLAEECGNLALPAWKAEFTKGKYAGTCDPSVIVNPASRIINFYIEGLRWMCESWGIDGIYVDDTGLDRFDIQRARRVLDGRRAGAKIDLHSWNHFHDWWGESWGHNAVMYAELFPYIDSLWFGEGFNFDEINPVEMLVECSGLPFGLMSEMLEGGGNPWRGLLFGETARAGWRENGPEGVWAMRAAYGFDQAKLRGWWEENPPAKASDPRVLVTLYELPEGAMLCAASFAGEPISVSFTLNADFTPTSAHLPEIEHVQAGSDAAADGVYTIEPGKGVVIYYKR